MRQGFYWLLRAKMKNVCTLNIPKVMSPICFHNKKKSTDTRNKIAQQDKEKKSLITKYNIGSSFLPVMNYTNYFVAMMLKYINHYLTVLISNVWSS